MNSEKRLVATNRNYATLLLANLNDTFIEEITESVKSDTRDFFQSFMCHELMILTNREIPNHESAGDFIWHEVWQKKNEGDKLLFLQTLREEFLEDFIWGELERLDVDLVSHGDALSDEITDAAVEACDAIAKGYMMLLRTRSCNPSIESFVAEINPPLRRAYNRIQQAFKEAYN